MRTLRSGIRPSMRTVLCGNLNQTNAPREIARVTAGALWLDHADKLHSLTEARPTRSLQ